MSCSIYHMNLLLIQSNNAERKQKWKEKIPVTNAASGLYEYRAYQRLLLLGRWTRRGFGITMLGEEKIILFLPQEKRTMTGITWKKPNKRDLWSKDTSHSSAYKNFQDYTFSTQAQMENSVYLLVYDSTNIHTFTPETPVMDKSLKNVWKVYQAWISFGSHSDVTQTSPNAMSIFLNNEYVRVLYILDQREIEFSLRDEKDWNVLTEWNKFILQYFTHVL